MTIHEFPMTREQGLREARIRNLHTALYMCENLEEVHLALQDVHPENLKAMIMVIHRLLEEPTQ